MSGKRKTLLQRWRQHTLGNQVVVITGILVTFSSIVYTLTTMYQAHLFRQNAEETGKQTDKMIAASERIANVSATMAEDARKANAEMLDRAERITRTNEQLAAAATKQATVSQTQANASVAQAEVAKQALGATQSSARAAEESAQIARFGQLPVIDGVGFRLTKFAPGEKASTAFGMLVNTGNTPAYNVTAKILSLDSPTVLPRNFDYDEPRNKGIYVSKLGVRTAQEVGADFTILPQHFEAIKRGERYLYWV